MTDGELRDLVEKAKQPVSDQLDEPPPARRAFSELVREGTALAAKQWEARGAMVEKVRWWASWVVADPSDTAAVDELARRRLRTICIEDAAEGPRDVLDQVVVQGEGVELLRQPGTATLVAYVHSGISPMFGVLSECASALFMPDRWPGRNQLASPETRARKPQREKVGSRSATYEYGEWLGIRWVGPERRYDVFRELLTAGEKCLLPVLHPGHGEGRLFDRPVRVSTAGARLAIETGSPLVLATGSYDDSNCAVHVSRDLARQAQSEEALLDLVLKTAEEELNGDPAQISASMFPTPELVEWRTKAEALKRDAAEAAEAAWRAKDAYDEQIVAAEELRDEGADREDMRAAMVTAEEARLGMREAREAMGVAKARWKALRRPERQVQAGGDGA